MLKRINNNRKPKLQHGVAAVEFAIVAILLFIMLFGILEFGRIFYVFNTVQEVTRRAAREAVVSNWGTADLVNVKAKALFGNTSLPAFADISGADIDIDYLTELGGVVGAGGQQFPGSPTENISACINPSGKVDCIAFVRVSINGVTYVPMVGLFTGIEYTGLPFSKNNPFKIDLSIPIPASTVTMPAESLGYPG